MPVFDLAPGHYVYRPLAEDANGPLMKGWDVYALQTALRGFAFELALDGIYGDHSSDAVAVYQTARNLEVDGIAGIVTQTSLCDALAARFRKEFKLPLGLPRGAIEKECGFQVGNHTAPYTSGDAQGSRDLGILQRNSRYHEIEESFDVMDSLREWCEQIRERHDHYVDLGQVSNGRAWGLAVGSWNAPAYANWLAGQRTGTVAQPGPSATAALEAYIAAAMKYTRWATSAN